jgi:hypothetical protein
MTMADIIIYRGFNDRVENCEARLKNTVEITQKNGRNKADIRVRDLDVIQQP